MGFGDFQFLWNAFKQWRYLTGTLGVLLLVTFFTQEAFGPYLSITHAIVSVWDAALGDVLTYLVNLLPLDMLAEITRTEARFISIILLYVPVATFSVLVGENSTKFGALGMVFISMMLVVTVLPSGGQLESMFTGFAEIAVTIFSFLMINLLVFFGAKSYFFFLYKVAAIILFLELLFYLQFDDEIAEAVMQWAVCSYGEMPGFAPCKQ